MKTRFYLQVKCISKSFYRIWEAEVSKSKSMNKELESKSFYTIEQKAIVWWQFFK